MEEQNPWLDPESVKHINKKIDPDVKESNKTHARYNRKNNKEDKKLNSQETSKKDSQDKKDKCEVVHIGSIKNEKKEEYQNFLQVLVNEFTTNMPLETQKFAKDNFDEKWLEEFLKDVEDLKHDLLNSKFFPSQKDIIFLKYIFLLNQSF